MCEYCVVFNEYNKKVQIDTGRITPGSLPENGVVLSIHVSDSLSWQFPLFQHGNTVNVIIGGVKFIVSLGARGRLHVRPAHLRNRVYEIVRQGGGISLRLTREFTRSGGPVVRTACDYIEIGGMNVSIRGKGAYTLVRREEGLCLERVKEDT